MDDAEAVVAAARGTLGDDLRDVWVFDTDGAAALYLRADVREQVAEFDLSNFIDNERYGYITRDTYEALTYAEYEYTVRGFAGFEQFRTFVGDLGFLVSSDRGEPRDFAGLRDALTDLDLEYGTLAVDAVETLDA